MSSVKKFIKANVVLLIAWTAALLSMLPVPPDAAYAGYFDWRTLACLFSTLAAVCALRGIRFFRSMADAMVMRLHTLRRCVVALVAVTFAGSMLLANDMALLTFLPLSLAVLTAAGHTEYAAVTFLLQNLAANLGGMITPFGNPQSLFLYTRVHLPTFSFMRVMLPCFITAALLLFLLCLRIPPLPVTLNRRPTTLASKPRAALYFVLFTASIVAVLRWLPWQWTAAAVFLCLLVTDRPALCRVDYGLLLTFTAFFIFAGNMARIPLINEILSRWMAAAPLPVSLLCCQCISNVPSAVLLAPFTDNWPALLLGVNIGGTGTLIASLASLITFREYGNHFSGQSGKYLKLFALYNLLFLLILSGVAWLTLLTL